MKPIEPGCAVVVIRCPYNSGKSGMVTHRIDGESPLCRAYSSVWGVDFPVTWFNEKMGANEEINAAPELMLMRIDGHEENIADKILKEISA